VCASGPALDSAMRETISWGYPERACGRLWLNRIPVFDIPTGISSVVARVHRIISPKWLSAGMTCAGGKRYRSVGPEPGRYVETLGAQWFDVVRQVWASNDYLMGWKIFPARA